MRVGRVEAGGEIHFCEPDDDGVRLLDGSIAQGFTRGPRRLGAGEYRQMSPLQPGKILVVLGAFQRDHGLEAARPTAPTFAAKLPSAVISPGAEVVVPPAIGDAVTVEPELAVVIGKRARHCSPDDVFATVFGYMCFNDVTHLPFIREHGDFLRAKSIDTFGPCGPWIDTEITERDIDAGLAITAYVNDAVVHTGNTKEFTHRVGEVVSEAARYYTLEPGDVISLGTPPDPALAKVGDTVRIEIEKVGSLTNTIVAGGSEAKSSEAKRSEGGTRA
jgi:2-keto-4-pentenoate hydratase/2-oxohepta-3-ene-1,7-dioic acid hydratase in catechol pathway